jgi:peroxiredoxin
MTDGMVIDVLGLALATLFAVAGAAKLADLRGAARAAREFGAPQRLALPLGALLSCVEIAIAVGLLVTSSARAAAATGAAMLIVLAAAVAGARLRGRTPDCHCFGRLHSAPAGWGVVARNVAFAGVAILLASQPHDGTGAGGIAAFVVIAAIAAQAALWIVLLRRYGAALHRIDELDADRPRERSPLEMGGVAPSFSLPTDGGAIALGDLLRRGRAVLLVFVDADCGPCHALMPEVARWSRELADRFTTVVVATGPSDESDLFARHADSLELVAQEDREVAELYGVEATPSAVLVGTDGRITRRSVAGAAAITDLVRTLEGSSDDKSHDRGRPSVPRVATATSLAAASAFVVAAESLASTGRATQDPSVADLQSIHATLRAAGPRLVAATRRSSKAVVALATLRPGATLRKKQAAAARALELERKEVLSLSAALEALQFTTRDAYNARASALIGLSRFALSLQKRKRALTATPKAASVLLADSDRLYQSGLDSVAASAQILGRG